MFVNKAFMEGTVQEFATVYMLQAVILLLGNVCALQVTQDHNAKKLVRYVFMENTTVE